MFKIQFKKGIAHQLFADGLLTSEQLSKLLKSMED